MPFIVGRVPSTARRPRVDRNSADSVLTFRWLTDCLFLVVTMLHHTNLKRELRTLVTFSISALWLFCAVVFLHCSISAQWHSALWLFCTVSNSPFIYLSYAKIMNTRDVEDTALVICSPCFPVCAFFPLQAMLWDLSRPGQPSKYKFLKRLASLTKKLLDWKAQALITPRDHSYDSFQHCA